MLKFKNSFVEKYWSITYCIVQTNTRGGVSLIDTNIQNTVVSGTIQEVFDFCKQHTDIKTLEYMFGATNTLELSTNTFKT